MRLKSLLALVFVAAMLFALGGNAAPPDNSMLGKITKGEIGKFQGKLIGPLHLEVPDHLNFSGKVLRVGSGPVPGDGGMVYPWLCKALVENYECTTEETCGVSTLWLYVTKDAPLGTIQCTMLSQAASSGDRAWVDGSCLELKGSPWCGLTGLQVIGVGEPQHTCPGCPACPETNEATEQPGDSGATDIGATEQPGDSGATDKEATTQP